MKLPNPLPRPPRELEQLQAVWAPLKGWRILSAVNNTYIGLFYLGAALLFFVLAGVLALLMRTQLAIAENGLLDADTYNQLFTMHGSVMMFLFAVPAVEAIAILLLPQMLGARDLPFPRLSAYAFWAYLIGGLVFFATIFFDLAPDGGWFMYPPLTGERYSPGLRADFWLLGIGFIEISAIAGAVEIIVGILRTRPPGMTLAKMPVYVWSMLVVACMIVFAFPPVIVATALLELERAFDWPFFIAARGGDPVLWQHLFWLFGHPDVYIIFLPAAGLVSMIVPTMSRTKLLGYRPIVLALIATGVISFALWVHHMFATGMPHHAATWVSAASLTVAIPTGVQVAAWLATLWRGNVMRATPTWFLLGFFGVFVLGGLTGVMLAIVPYDWQVHDTYFVVAHLHYVMIGGLLFPMFAAIYYWAPAVTGTRLSETLGKWACGTLFVGVNVTFFPLHILGLAGMPRRVWTYDDALGWEPLNLLATCGAFLTATGIALVILDLVLHLRFKSKIDVNPWQAGTLEWLPMEAGSARSIPRMESREPLWDNPNLREEVRQGQHFLPGTATGGRETIVTSARDARPEYLLKLPGPSWLPFVAGLGTAVFFFALTVKFFFVAAFGAVATLAAIWRWLWESEPAPTGKSFDIGAGIRLPDHMHGPRSHSWWAMVVLLTVDSAIFASLAFAHFYLPTAPPLETNAALLIASAAALLIAAPAMMLARRQLVTSSRPWFMFALILASATLLVGSLLPCALWGSGLQPGAYGRHATLSALFAWQAVHGVLLTLMCVFAGARMAAGKLGSRRSAFDNTYLMALYAVVQGLISISIAIASL